MRMNVAAAGTTVNRRVSRHLSAAQSSGFNMCKRMQDISTGNQSTSSASRTTNTRLAAASQTRQLARTPIMRVILGSSLRQRSTHHRCTCTCSWLPVPPQPSIHTYATCLLTFDAGHPGQQPVQEVEHTIGAYGRAASCLCLQKHPQTQQPLVHSPMMRVILGSSPRQKLSTPPSL
jgi:hypothetical protein